MYQLCSVWPVQYGTVTRCHFRVQNITDVVASASMSLLYCSLGERQVSLRKACGGLPWLLLAPSLQPRESVAMEVALPAQSQLQMLAVLPNTLMWLMKGSEAVLLSSFQIPDPQKWWDNKYLLFLIAKCWGICYAAIDNSNVVLTSQRFWTACCMGQPRPYGQKKSSGKGDQVAKKGSL